MRGRSDSSKAKAQATVGDTAAGHLQQQLDRKDMMFNNMKIQNEKAMFEMVQRVSQLSQELKDSQIKVSELEMKEVKLVKENERLELEAEESRFGDSGRIHTLQLAVCELRLLGLDTQDACSFFSLLDTNQTFSYSGIFWNLWTFLGSVLCVYVL